MSEINLKINRISDEAINLKLEPGKLLFIVGPNGSGKSALIHQFVRTYSNDKRVRWIAAHRQTWLESGATNLTTRSRQEYEESRSSYASRQDARWRDIHPTQHLSAVLYDLGAKENAGNRSIVRLMRKEAISEARAMLAETPSPFDLINQLLGRGCLNVDLEYLEDGSIVAKREEGATYDIAQMSDGERSAMIIAAQVITAEPGSVFLIDEPERHLHRSIIVPLLSALFALRREDCAFVISTHEVALPVANSDAPVVMLQSCEWHGAECERWDAELLRSRSLLPEELKLAILGGRRKILFVEGEHASLDRPFYTALFPEVSVLSMRTCQEVERAVRGLRSAPDLHHTEAFGVIDRDNRSNENVAKLAKEGVIVLEVCSVEGLYYCSEAIKVVGRLQAKSFGCDAEELIREVREKAIEKLQTQELAERMAARRCERQLRDRVMSSLPDSKSIREDPAQQIVKTIETDYHEEMGRYTEFIERGDLDGLVARYPLRETGVFDVIAETLKIRTRRDYEQIVVARIGDDNRFRDYLKDQLRTLLDALDASASTDENAVV